METATQRNSVIQKTALLTKTSFFVTDGGNNCINVFDQSGTFFYKFGKQGNQDGQFMFPRGILLDSSNNLLACDYYNNRVQ